MTARRTRALAGARQVALTVGAVAGVLCIVVTLATVVFGVRPLIFRSGSMSPTIDTGAIAFAQPRDAADLAKGDIVSVIAPSGSRVTHRIYSIEHLPGEAILELKGDANRTADEAPYRIRHADVVLFDIPFIGYVISWLTSPVGLVLLGLYAAFLLSILFRRSPGDDVPPTGEGRSQAPRRAGRRRKETPPQSTPRALVLLSLMTATLVSALAMQGWTQPTLAAWTDAGTVTGTTQTAYTVPAPSGSNCTVASGGSTTSRGVVLSWPLVTSPALSYNKSVSGVTTLSETFSDASPNKRLTVLYNPGTSGNLSKVVTVTSSAFLTAKPAWVSPTTTWQFKTGPSNTVPPSCYETNAPTGTITAPNTTSRARTTMATYLSGASACTTTGRIFCGTMADASYISNVDYTLTRGSSCWSGTAWVTTGCTTFRAATLNGTTGYYGAGTVANVYNTTGTYNLTVRITDTWGTATTLPLRTFTLT